MKRSELNKIIKGKLDSIDDTAGMKGFLNEILNFEVENLESGKSRFKDYYLDLASKYTGK